ncbi:MAG: glycosyltransferase, partial [Bacteroidota bacterium]
NETGFIKTLRAYCDEKQYTLLGIGPFDATGNQLFHLTSPLFFSKKNYFPLLNPYIYVNKYASELKEKIEQLVRQTGKIEFAIVRLNGTYNVGSGSVFSKLKIPYAVKSLHNDYGLPGTVQSSKKQILLQFLYRPLLKKTLQKAKFIDSPQAQYVDFYRRVYNLRNIGFVSNGVNPDHFLPLSHSNKSKRAELGISETSIVVGYCGGKPMERGVAQLIEIADELIKEIPSVIFLIVGGNKNRPGTDIDEIKSLTKKAGLADRFICTGFVPFEVVHEYIGLFNVGIALDTKENVAAYGNSSQKIFQYISMGVPAIFPMGTNQFISQSYGSAVEVDDTKGLCREILHWIAHPPDPNSAHTYTKATFSISQKLRERLSHWQIGS